MIGSPVIGNLGMVALGESCSVGKRQTPYGNSGENVQLERSTAEPHHLSPGVVAGPSKEGDAFGSFPGNRRNCTNPTPYSELQRSSDSCRVPVTYVGGRSSPETWYSAASLLPMHSQPGFVWAAQQNPNAEARQVTGQPERSHLSMTRPVTSQSFLDTTGPVSHVAMTRPGSRSLSRDATGQRSYCKDPARQKVDHLATIHPGSQTFLNDSTTGQTRAHVAMPHQVSSPFHYGATSQSVTLVNTTQTPVSCVNTVQPSSQAFFNASSTLPAGYVNMARPGTGSVVIDRIDSNYQSISAPLQNQNNYNPGIAPGSIIPLSSIG